MARIYVRPVKNEPKTVKETRKRIRSGQVTVYTSYRNQSTATWLYPRANVRAMTLNELQRLID